MAAEPSPDSVSLAYQIGWGIAAGVLSAGAWVLGLQGRRRRDSDDEDEDAARAARQRIRALEELTAHQHVSAEIANLRWDLEEVMRASRVTLELRLNALDRGLMRVEIKLGLGPDKTPYPGHEDQR